MNAPLGHGRLSTGVHAPSEFFKSVLSPLQPEGRKASRSRSRHKCSICGREYARSQDLKRHHLDKHEEPGSCLFCVFKWRRPYQLKKHIERYHPNISLPAALAEATRSRRTATVTKTRIQRRASSPAIGYDGRDESPPQPLTPLPAAMSRAAYDPQPELTEQMNTITGP